MGNSEIKGLKGIARKLIPLETLKKIVKLKEIHEKINLLKYSIKSNLEIRIHNLEKEIDGLNEIEENFHLLTKAKLLNVKIKYFYIDYEKKEFDRIFKELKSLEKEVKKVKKIV